MVLRRCAKTQPEWFKVNPKKNPYQFREMLSAKEMRFRLENEIIRTPLVLSFGATS